MPTNTRRNAVLCPKHGKRNTLLDRTGPSEHSVRRRRRCVDCGAVFFTEELIRAKIVNSTAQTDNDID